MVEVGPSEESVTSAVGRLRAEVAEAHERERRARLLYEIAELEEGSGDLSGAARDYLAAHTENDDFRESLEGLVRLLDRRRSLGNAAKILDALQRAAVSPEERARAAILRAGLLQDQQDDPQGARAAAREATESDAGPGEAATGWLYLELLAARLDVPEERLEALHARAKLAESDDWRGLLLIDVARLVAAEADLDRAIEVLGEARALRGRASFAAAVALEEVCTSERVGAPEAVLRHRAAAIESQGDFIAEALSSAEVGDALGVPRWRRSVTHATDAWIRAAALWDAAGEPAKAGALFDRALASLGDAGDDAVRGLLHRARVRSRERSHDAAGAAQALEEGLAAELPDALGASFALRLAHHAVKNGAEDVAFQAIGWSISTDGLSVPARALQYELLARKSDSPGLAVALEAFAEHLEGDARARALTLAAFLWVTRGNDTAQARRVLGSAGWPSALRERLARSLARSAGDDEWFEAASTTLAADPSAAEEAHRLVFDVVRSLWLRGEEDVARGALAALASTGKGARVAALLEVLLPGVAADARAAALRKLRDEGEPELKALLTLVLGLGSLAAGDREGALQELTAAAAHQPNDLLVRLLVAETARKLGKVETAAEALEGAAGAASQPKLAAALHLEAGFLRFRADDHAGGALAFQAAEESSSGSAADVLPWAKRAEATSSVEAKRAAIDAALDLRPDDPSLCLERFTLEVLAGDPDGALEWLERAEGTATGDLAVAAALARIVYDRASADQRAVGTALGLLGDLGDAPQSLSAAEKARLAREDGASELQAAARHWYVSGNGGLPAALGWLSAAMTTRDVNDERRARAAVADELGEDDRVTVRAAASHLGAVVTYDHPVPLLGATTKAARLVNADLAPPGSDPRRRAAALSEIGDAIGEDAELDTCGLAGWSALASGQPELALQLFRYVTSAHPDDIAAWEGQHAAGIALDDREAIATAAEQLGAQVADPTRGAALWEEAASAWFSIGGGYESRAESALEASFARDARRLSAFDRLFRRVRERKDHDKLLAIVERRLAVTESNLERAKLVWERARALREQGDVGGAMTALATVRELEPDHVGALALMGEILIRRGQFEPAAEALARLSTVEGAPAKNRVTAGVTAVDLYENKLDRFDLSLDVLMGLHQAGLSTLPVRERLARAAARTSRWDIAVSMLESLMQERAEPAGRLEAAKLALVIYRDRMNAPEDAARAVEKILGDSPADGDALDLLLVAEIEPSRRAGLLARGRDATLQKLQEDPLALQLVKRVARVAATLSDRSLEQAALSVASALGDHGADTALRHAFVRAPRAPQAPLSEVLARHLAAPGDAGPAARLFQALGPTLAEAFGPTLASVGVTKKDRVDAKAGLTLRTEIAAWAAAFGIPQFELYVGGKDPFGVQGIPGAPPSIIVGPSINVPFDPQTRARIGRELFAIHRGTSILRSRDDATVAAIGVAACNIAKVPLNAPPLAVLAEVERLLRKAISGKTKGLLPDICRELVSSGQDVRGWSVAAMLSLQRASLVACGDATTVVAELSGIARERVPEVVAHDVRTHALLRFGLSPSYLELRRGLRLEADS